MAKFNRKNYTRASGAQIGKTRKRITSCESCNFMELYEKGKESHKTGADCPRCKAPTVRVFDSQAEFTRGRELKILLEAGEINDLEYQPSFTLHAPDFETGEPVALYKYVPDFSYFKVLPDGKQDYVVEDVKNKSMVMTDVAVMKMKHLQAEYGIEVELVGR